MMTESQIRAWGYEGFKQELDKEFYSAANSFCRIGYLLRLAKDTDILYESGYQTLNEFAKAEYGLTPDMVSRYIRINEKYSVDGYGETLLKEYEGYGVAKLAEIMTLPDELAEEIPPEMPKAKILELKKEIKEEEKVTDIEVALEEPGTETNPDYPETLLGQFLYEFFRLDENAYRLRDAAGGEDAQYLEEVFAPGGTGSVYARIPRVGQVMLIVKGHHIAPKLMKVRTLEKQELSWEEVWEELWKLFDKDSIQNASEKDQTESENTEVCVHPEEPDGIGAESSLKNVSPRSGNEEEKEDTNRGSRTDENVAADNTAELEYVEGEVVQQTEQIKSQTAAAISRRMDAIMTHAEHAERLLGKAELFALQRRVIDLRDICGGIKDTLEKMDKI